MTVSDSSEPIGNDSRTERALYLIERLEEAPVSSEKELAELTQWVSSSRDNYTSARDLLDLRAGLRAHRAARATRGEESDTQYWINVARLRAVDIEACSPDSIEHSIWRPVPHPVGEGWLSRLPLNSAVLVSLCLIAVVAVVFLISYGEKEYSSRQVNQRVVLWDRSVVDLYPHSVAGVQFTNESRYVEIKDGGAEFEVVSDDPRPFKVRASAATVTVQGTRFYVRLVGVEPQREAEVGVRSGFVNVSASSRSSKAHRLQANQSARISVDGSLKIISMAAAVRPLTAFVDEPLSKVVQKFNERGRRPKVVVQGSACKVLINGTWDIDQLLEVIGHDPKLKKYGGEGDEVVVIRGIGDAAATRVGGQLSDCEVPSTGTPHSVAADMDSVIGKTGAPAQGSGERP